MATGGVAVGLVALAFAACADQAQQVFSVFLGVAPAFALAVIPLAYGGITYITNTWAHEARGSGIPQVIASLHKPTFASKPALTSFRTGVFKFVLTLAVLAVGGSVGREGPTVQISAAVMKTVQRAFGVDITPAILMAGGAAGLSAAFNTPLAGIAFTIEELVSAYEERLVVLAMGAVMIAGLVSLGIAGDYIYFGAMHEKVSILRMLEICPTAGVVGGLSGGLFSLAGLRFGQTTWPPIVRIRQHPVLWACACGALVAVVGYASGGTTWGTGYVAAKAIVEGHGPSLWFGPSKIFVTLVTSLSGVPGGIFAPSLSAGAGIGALISTLFPSEPSSAIGLLGMAGYFVGVVRSPLTAVLIIYEMTDSRQIVVPLIATALIADVVSHLVCHESLYHGLARAYRAERTKPSGTG